MSTLEWLPSVSLGAKEQLIAKRLKRTGRLFLFLREHRHELFDSEFQSELAAMYAGETQGGRPAKPPAMLAMVTLLQAYQQTSDAVAVENTVLDRRWQLVLDCADCDEPLFSQGALVDFRHRLIAKNMDRRLLERTVELAKKTRAFGHKALRVALDSAPLWGARRVEDTFNLIGHAMDVVVRCAASVASLSSEEVRQQAGCKLLGNSSIKAALDIDWDSKSEQQQALARLLADAAALKAWVSETLDNEANVPLKEALELLSRVIEQDIEPDPEGGGSRIREGTAQDRRISVEDGEMRHGRKSKSRVINGFKRHIAAEVDTGLILAASVRPANEREFQAEDTIRPDVERLGKVVELHIDRGYLSGSWPKELHEAGQEVFSKPWTSRSSRYGKGEFIFDFETRTATCPNGATTDFTQTEPDRPIRASFPTDTCRRCPVRDSCVSPKTKGGRSLVLHSAEALLQDLRHARRTTEGRKRLRKRVTIEHRLAHVTRRQGRVARYIGTRKNTFDLRRTAAVENLHCIQRRAC